MKNKFFTGLICLITVFLFVFGTVPVESQANTVGEAQSLIDGIVAFKQEQAGASSIQGWIDGALTNGAGVTSEWYILALSQYGNYQFSSYQNALKIYLNNNTVYSASSRQKYALAFVATGSADSYISSVMEDSIGKQGVMSWVYGLHLLNNGYVSTSYSTASVKQKLLSLQLSDGGWAISGSNGDVDATAMAIQALAPHYHNDSTVKTAVDKALILLSNRQLEDGDYANYGVANPESTAQVLTSLALLGIDGATDSRFIKNGNTLFDGIKKYQLSDGGYSHTLGGAYNDTATSQVFYSMIAYVRMSNGNSSFYIFDKRNPSALPVNPPSSGTEDNSSSVESTTQEEMTSQESASQNGNTNSNDKIIEETDTTETTESESEITTETVDASQETESQEQKDSKEQENLDSKNERKTSGSYKPWVTLIIVVLAGVISLIFFIRKKRNKKNFIAIAVVSIIAIVFVWMTDFYSADTYYHGEQTQKENAIGTVVLSIRCDTIVGKSDSSYIPKDGIILDETEFTIQENDTVYDILTEAARTYGIQMENNGTEELAYITGINYLYEFDFGDLSGWTYLVNDQKPSVGCGEYVLEDGDVIEWHYTCELGNDL